MRDVHDASDEPGGAADRGEQQALGEQLLDETDAAGAERHAHGDFPAPRRGAGEQQVGDVGARHEQDERDRGEDDAADRQDQRPDLGQRRKGRAVGREVHRPAGGLGSRSAAPRSRQLRRARMPSDTAGLIRPMTISQPMFAFASSSRSRSIVVCSVTGTKRSSGTSCVPVNPAAATPTIRNGDRFSITVAADDGRIGRERGAPEPIAQDGGGCGARRAVGPLQRAPGGGAHAAARRSNRTTPSVASTGRGSAPGDRAPSVAALNGENARPRRRRGPGRAPLRTRDTRACWTSHGRRGGRRRRS